jgi:hypothetical protein
MNQLILLLAGHALCDYPLQGDFLSRAKNAANPIPGVPWWQAMWAHAAIHAGMVLLVLGMWPFALAEFVIHFGTDYAKCSGRISYNVDQSIHIGCKVAWLLIAVLYV